MEVKCKNCGYDGVPHQIGRMREEEVIIEIRQCPRCMFLIDVTIDI